MPQEMNDGGPVEGMSLRDHQDFAAHILAEEWQKQPSRNHWLDCLAYASRLPRGRRNRSVPNCRLLAN